MVGLQSDSDRQRTRTESSLWSHAKHANKQKLPELREGAKEYLLNTEELSEFIDEYEYAWEFMLEHDDDHKADECLRDSEEVCLDTEEDSHLLAIEPPRKRVKLPEAATPLQGVLVVNTGEPRQGISLLDPAEASAVLGLPQFALKFEEKNSSQEAVSLIGCCCISFAKQTTAEIWRPAYEDFKRWQRSANPQRNHLRWQQRPNRGWIQHNNNV